MLNLFFYFSTATTPSYSLYCCNGWQWREYCFRCLFWKATARMRGCREHFILIEHAKVNVNLNVENTSSTTFCHNYLL